MPMPRRGGATPHAIDHALPRASDSCMTRTGWAVFCLLLLPVAACGASSHATATRSSSPAPTSPITPNPSASASAAVIAAYTGTYADVEDAVRAGSLDSSALGRHATGAAVDQLKQGVEQYINLGVVPVGVPVLHARVTSVVLAANPPEAVIAACPAAPALVNLKSGQPVQSKALPPNPVTVNLQTLQGHWVVSLFTADRSKTCSA